MLVFKGFGRKGWESIVRRKPFSASIRCWCLTLSVLAVIGSSSGPAQAIVGGDFLRANADGSSPYPWFAALFYSDPRAVADRDRRDSFCGGSLIGRKYVITASHCVDGIAANKRHSGDEGDPKINYSGGLHVRLGHTNRNPDDPSSGSTGIVRKVVRMHMSQNWQGSGGNGGDYTILELEEPVPGTDEDPVNGIDPVEIADKMPEDGTRLYALGHGISRYHTYGGKSYGTTTDRTKIASYDYHTNDKCVEERRRADIRINGRSMHNIDDMSNDVYCGYIDNIREGSHLEYDPDSYPDPGSACNGDSGGPHFYLKDGVPRLVGVTSYGKLGCEGPKYSVRLGWRNPDSPGKPSAVRQWINAVLDGKNPFTINAERGRTHTITLQGTGSRSRDFRGHAGYIMGRTPDEKGGAEDHLELRWTGALTFDISNIDNIRVDGYYWELPKHRTLKLQHVDENGELVETDQQLEVEIENGLFAVNGTLFADLNTESLNLESEKEEYGYIYGDKAERYDVWNKGIIHAGDDGDWYLAEHDVRNNPTLSGEGTVIGKVGIHGGGLHTPGHRYCVLKATRRDRDRYAARCFLEDDIVEYLAHRQNPFGTFTVKADENNLRDDGIVYWVDKGGALVADIHPDGRHDQVRVVGGNASIEGTLVGLFSDEGRYGDLAYYPLIQTDPDKAIVDEDGEGIDWDKIVMQGANAYYNWYGDKLALPEQLSEFDILRLRTTATRESGGKAHISDGFFLRQKNSPFADFDDDNPFAVALSAERERLGVENFKQPEDEDYLEVDADFVKENRQKWSLFNGMSINTPRKLRQLGSNSSLAAASLAGQALAGAHANSVHDRMAAALSGDGFELMENRKNQYSGVADVLGLWSRGVSATPFVESPFGLDDNNALTDLITGQRMDFGREIGSGLDDHMMIGMWSQVFGARGRIDNGDDPESRRSSSGMTFGIDMPIATDTLLGISAGFSRAKFTSGVGVSPVLVSSAESEMEIYNVGAYGGIRNGAFRFSGEARFGQSKIKSVRPLDILRDEPGFSRAKFDGTFWHGSLEAGWRFDLDAPALDDVENGRLSLEPFAGVEFLHQSFDGFREAGYGDGLLDVGVAPNDQFSVTGSLGAKFTYSYRHEQSMIDASLSAYWNGELHRKGTNTASLTYDFLAGQGGIATGDDLANIGKSATVIRTGFRFRPLREGLPVLSFSYDARIRDGLQSGTVSGQLSWKF